MWAALQNKKYEIEVMATAFESLYENRRRSQDDYRSKAKEYFKRSRSPTKVPKVAKVPVENFTPRRDSARDTAGYNFTPRIPEASKTIDPHTRKVEKKVKIEEPKKVLKDVSAFSITKWFRPYSASDDEENTKPMEVGRRMSNLINHDHKVAEKLKTEAKNDQLRQPDTAAEIFRRRSSKKRKTPNLILKMRNKDMNTPLDIVTTMNDH
jgi:hypothetical protein